MGGPGLAVGSDPPGRVFVSVPFAGWGGGSGIWLRLVQCLCQFRLYVPIVAVKLGVWWLLWGYVVVVGCIVRMLGDIGHVLGGRCLALKGCCCRFGACFRKKFALFEYCLSGSWGEWRKKL